MLHQPTLNFLNELKNNNSKEWLDQNRAAYEIAKNDVLNLAQELIISVSNLDKTIFNACLDPKKCITRLNRDLRFAKFKIPYKTDYYIVLSKNGKNSTSAFYFLHIEPGNCFVGGGVYNPLADQLKKIRKEISVDYKTWLAILNHKSFQKTFPSGIHSSGILQKIPRDFEAGDPASKFLKMQGFYTSIQISDAEITSVETFEKINLYFRAAKPLVDFLNRAISDQTITSSNNSG